MARKLKLSRHAAYTRAYKVRRNLKAKKLLKKGYTTSRDIIDYNTNKNIVKFIKTFVQKMKENDLASLHSYLENIDKDKIECLDIAEILDYDVKLKENFVHEILIPHLNSKGEVGFCGARFRITKQKKIKIIEIITKPQSVLAISKPITAVRKQLPREYKGIIQIKATDAKEVLLED